MPIQPEAACGAAAVVSLTGECGAYDEPVLAALLRGWVAAGRPVIVDFSRATCVDSIVLGTLLAILREAERAELPLVLYVPERPGAEVHRVFSISGLDQFLPLRRTWGEALAVASELAPGDGGVRRLHA